MTAPARHLHDSDLIRIALQQRGQCVVGSPQLSSMLHYCLVPACRQTSCCHIRWRITQHSCTAVCSSTLRPQHSRKNAVCQLGPVTRAWDAGSHGCASDMGPHRLDACAHPPMVASESRYAFWASRTCAALAHASAAPQRHGCHAQQPRRTLQEDMQMHTIWPYSVPAELILLDSDSYLSSCRVRGAIP